jgi:hypothetical protein
VSRPPDAAAARRRRQAAAQRFRPAVVDTLLVVEAPPSALDRYFYFDDVQTHDSLFRHVVEGLLGEKPTRDKLPWLDELRDRGVYLVDMSVDPFTSRRDVLPACVDLLVDRCRELAPRRVVLIGVVVYDLTFGPLTRAGVPVVDARIPFPGSGQQRRFLDAFRAATGCAAG